MTIYFDIELLSKLSKIRLTQYWCSGKLDLATDSD